MSGISTTATFSGPTSLWKILLTDWRFWLPGAIFSFYLANILLSGWSAGVIPDLSFPYSYGSDASSYGWLIERAKEGWVFDNPRSGYPFGSNFLDYPGSDTSNHLIAKILGLITGEYYSAFNLFVLLSFVITFVTTFIVSRSFGLNAWYSFTSAMLFVFLPFHYFRITHLYYTWYFVAPLFFYIAFYFFYLLPVNYKRSNKGPSLCLWFIALLALASFGVYYALFGMIVLTIGGLAGWAKNGVSSLKWTISAVAVLIFGIFLNITPNLIHHYHQGDNPEVAVRSPAEAEIHGFKLMQLILPRDNHRLSSLAKFKQRYNNTHPLTHENSTATLGLIGSLGFLFLGITLIRAFSEKKIDTRMALLGLFVLVLFLFGTIGGLGSLFSNTISASIRGWNRISVFIAFGTITAFFLFTQIIVDQFSSSIFKKAFIISSSLILLALGLYDQAVSQCEPCRAHIKSAFEMDRNFVQQIETTLSPHSAVYQLPYVGFPETPPLFDLDSYALTAGFLHSKTLKWSYAGTKGRDGDLFYRSLSQEPLEEQLNVIKRLGFAGIYLDGKGYQDEGKNMKESLTKLLGPPAVTRSDNKAFFFPIQSITPVNFSGLTPRQILEEIGYDVNLLIGRYKGSFQEGINFSRADWPNFVDEVFGLSGNESWGRWSDATLAPAVRIDFNTTLPNRFLFILTGMPFGPNADELLAVKIGPQMHYIKMTPNQFEARFLVDLDGEAVKSIELIPPKPTVAQKLGAKGDLRVLGVGLINMRFEDM